MATLYSTHFYDGSPLGGFHTLYTVATGFVAVIRNITCFGGGPYYTALTGPYLAYSDTGTIMWAARSPEAVNGHLYEYDGRIVVPAGRGIAASIVTAEAGNWAFTISGFLLSTP